MKFRDMPVRNKLLVGNILMILIPVLVILFILIMMLMFFFAATNSPNRSALSGESLKGDDSNYQVLLLVDTLCSEIVREDNPLKNRDFTAACEALEKAGAMIYVNGGVSYCTEGSSKSQVEETALGILPSYQTSDASPIYCRNDKGLFYRVPLQNAKGDSSVLMVTGTALSFPGQDYVFIEDVKDFIKMAIAVVGISAVVIIIATGAILTRRLARSILEPIAELRKGAIAIKNGDLDAAITSDAGDELGETCRDFDDMRRRLKVSLTTQQRIEESRKAMLAGISHDLSTPLTSIKGYVSGLIDGIADTPDKKEHYLRTIYHTAWDMEQLVDSLFLFSKLDAGGIPFHKEPTELAGYLTDFCEESALRLKASGFSLRFENRCQDCAMAFIDRIQFARALQNLTDNSLKYRKGTPDDSLTVTLERVAGCLAIIFTDNGRGIDPKQAEKIFESFYRTDPARSTAVKGSGLGLAIARQIVEAMDGTIAAKGALDQGMTITILLPEYRGTDA